MKKIVETISYLTLGLLFPFFPTPTVAHAQYYATPSLEIVQIKSDLISSGGTLSATDLSKGNALSLYTSADLLLAKNNKWGVATSYRGLLGNKDAFGTQQTLSLFALASYYKWQDRYLLSLGTRYLDKGRIDRVDHLGNAVDGKSLRTFEFSVDAAFALKVTSLLSLRANFSFIEGYSSRVSYNYLMGAGITYRTAEEMLTHSSAIFNLSLDGLGAPTVYSDNEKYDAPASALLNACYIVPHERMRYVVGGTVGMYFTGKQFVYALSSSCYLDETFSASLTWQQQGKENGGIACALSYLSPKYQLSLGYMQQVMNTPTKVLSLSLALDM